MGCKQSSFSLFSSSRVNPDAVQVIKPAVSHLNKQQLRGYQENTNRVPSFLVDQNDALFDYPKKKKQEMTNKNNSIKTQKKEKGQSKQSQRQKSTEPGSEGKKQSTLEVKKRLGVSQSQATLALNRGTEIDGNQSYKTQLGQFQISYNSQHLASGLLSGTNKQADPFNQTQMSLKSFNSNASAAHGGSQGSVVFYESEYLYQTMPTVLPSEILKDQNPTGNFTSQLNKPQTPNMQKWGKLRGPMTQASSHASLFSGSQSRPGQLKIQRLELDDLVADQPSQDPSQPKYLRIKIQEVYKQTGLPKPLKNAKAEEQEVFMVQNLFRVYKRLLLDILEEHAQCTKTNEQLNNRYENVLKVTKKEGVHAVMDAINYVKQQPLLKPFYWNKRLSKVCRLHAQECSKSNYSGHRSKKGEKPSQRMRKYGYQIFGGAQNIMNGSKSAIESVLNHIIDDGVPSRGHRKNILNPAHRTIGIASEVHPSMGVIIVCNYAFHYSTNKQPEPLKQIVYQWASEDQAEIARNMQLLNGDRFKYKVTFSYPFLIKTTTIAKTGDKGAPQELQVLNSRKNAELELYNEEF